MTSSMIRELVRVGPTDLVLKLDATASVPQVVHDSRVVWITILIYLTRCMKKFEIQWRIVGANTDQLKSIIHESQLSPTDAIGCLSKPMEAMLYSIVLTQIACSISGD